MRVLMIAPTPFFSDRGCHVRIYEEIKALQKKGIQVFLCTYHHGREMADVETYRTVKIPWYNKYSAGPSLHKFYVDPLLLGLCLKKIRDIKPDILHCHLHEGALIGIICRMMWKTPVVFDMQGSLTDELKAHNFLGGNRFVLGIMKLIEGKITGSANKIISSSGKCASFVCSEFGIDKTKIDVVPDGIDGSMFENCGEKISSRKKIGIPSDKKIVVYLGVLNKYQGVDLLLEAIKKIVSFRNDIYFVIMGYPNVAYYKMLAREMEIDSYIHFTGKVAYEKIAGFLQLGDIAVSPKLSETEANGKILNYMAAGLPTVVLDRTVNKEILGNAGVYAQAEANDLAEKIVNLLDSEEERRRLKEKLRARVKKYFLWDDMAEKIIKVYRTLLMNG